MGKYILPAKFKKNEILLKAVANNYRLAILEYLRGHEYASVGAIAENIGTSLHNTSKHLYKLEQVKLVSFKEDGNYRMYRLVRHKNPMLNYIVNKI